ncbi:MAG: hypothetical protein WA463_02330 [Terriglobales bacterium]
MEDGVAFCPHCGAPQIRVATASFPEPAVATVLPPDAADEVQPPAQPVNMALAPAGKIDWQQGARAAAVAGLLLALAIFVVSFIAVAVGLVLHLGQGPIGLLLLLGSWACMLAAGAAAVRLYRRRRPEAVISTGMGARLGILSGLLGFLFYSVPQALRLALFHSGAAIRETMQKAVEQAATQSPDPRAQEMMRNFMSPGALAAIFTFLVMLFFLVFLVFSSLGGVIGAAIWGDKRSS